MAKLDFSQFHPLDHRPGDARCRAHYGGWRRHLKLAWEFHRRDQVLGPIRRLLYCPLGRHRWQVWYTNPENGPTNVKPMCTDCSATRLPSEQEIDHEVKLPKFE